MTDHSDQRIDFSPLDTFADVRDIDRAVNNVMQRVRAHQRPPMLQADVLTVLAGHVRMLAAAVVLVVAGSTIALRTTSVATPQPSAVTASTDPIATWAATGAVPSAAQLVTYTQGYRQ